MDAVELPYPVDVAAPKLMGSEGFGRAGVVVKEVEPRESDSVSILLSHPIERCNSFMSQKGNVFMSDGTCSARTSDSASLDKIPEAEFYRNVSKLPSFQGEDVSEQLHCRGINCISSTPRPDGAQLQQRSEKASKSSTVCSKRQRITQSEESMSLAGVDDIKDTSDRLCARPLKGTTSEKIQLVKQKNHSNSKRGEKRNLRVSAKSKYDSFLVKAGSASFGAASGGNNFLGVYGLKSDAQDITKLTDDLSLIGLLDGTYELPNLGKDKGKKETNMSETLLHSVRKVGSILQLPRPVQPQTFAELDSSYKKISTCLSTAVSSGVDGGKEETCPADPYSGDKNQDSSSNPETSGDVLDFPLYQPKDILERLALPPPKDLELLLLDAAKPAVSSRNTSDLRPGKHISRRPSLPAFPWSYNFSGQSRSNADTVKLSSSKNTCQGRWGRIGNIASSLGVANDCFSNLDLLKYDDNLVPSEILKLCASEHKIAPYTSGGLPWSGWGSSSPATCSKAAHVPLESGGVMDYEVNENCPRILAAAQTLIDMATISMRQNKDGLVTWPKKASQKASKTRKSRANEKGEERSIAPMPFSGSNNLSRTADQAFPSKKPKLSIAEKKRDPGYTNFVGKGPINWSAPRSVRSSPGKSVRDSIAETRPSSTNVMKQSCMMPPPERVLDKASDGDHKMRKSVMEWQNGERDSIAERRDSSSSTIKQSSMMPPPARVLGKAYNSEQKRKACDSAERPKNSGMDKMVINWHYGGRDSIAETKHSSSNILKQSSMMPPPARVLDKARDSEQKIRKLVADWNNEGRDSLAETRHPSTNIMKQSCMMPPPARALDKACDGEERQRKIVIDKMTDWHDLGGRERME